jgi:hypothetical protein
MVAHSSVAERKNAAAVLHDVGEAAKQYLLSNWLN